MFKLIGIVLLLVSISGFSQNVVSVTGKSEISVKPDIVSMSFNIYNTKVMDLPSAKKELDRRTSKVIEALLLVGIDEKDITSEGFELDQYSDDENGCKNQYVYEVGRSFDLILRNLDQYNNVINILISGGVSNIAYAEAKLNESKKYEKQALKLAIEDAKNQASFLVEEFGGKLGSIKNIGHRKTSTRYDDEEVIVVSGIRSSLKKNADVYFTPAPVEISAEIYAEFEIEKTK